MAAQLLSGKGYSKVYNLSGGIKAWKNEVAIGPQDTGMYLFAPEAGPEDAIITGFGLEMGLRDFYLSMQSHVSSAETKELFTRLADIEILHQQMLLELYTDITGTSITLKDFQDRVVEPAMEGGLTTEQYLKRYRIDQESELEVLALAMSIEVQALDLYLRAADSSEVTATRDILLKIADEERSHIDRLGSYIDEHLELV